ncbi:MAG: zinc ABC transporter substrate-binding protein [Gemmatimonadales bacterium]|nr:zinc ABC transporter substrate-binding protein [Gemmatimonadales bacterium]
MIFPHVRPVIAALFFLLAPTTGIGQSPVRVVVSILPQVWFAEKIGGREIQVSVLVGPGQSPATYDPSARQMVLLQEAELFIHAGVPFEKGLLPRINRLAEGPSITGVPPSVHSPGHDNISHDHDGLDPHSWLDPLQAQVLADTLCAAFCRLRPESEALFLSRRKELRATLENLDNELRGILSPHEGKEFFVFHPAFGHFAAAYGLTQIPIEAGGHEPGARHLAEVMDHARRAGASAIIVQPQFSRKSASAVAQSLDLEVIVLDPLARRYDDNLRKIAHTMIDLFAKTTQRNPTGETAP